MTTAHGTEGWTAVVRRRLGPGLLLPLGEAADRTWLTEGAAAAELRRAALTVGGASPGRLRLSLADPDAPEALGTPDVLPPPGALPPGSLRIEAEFAAMAGEPLLAVAGKLREVLFGCAVDRLGLVASEVDLRVTALLDAADDSTAAATPMEVAAVSPRDEVALAAAAVPGVAHLTEALGSAVTRTPGQVRVELATAAGHRPQAVARAVRRTVSASVPYAAAVSVVVTAVEVAG
jgi:hypothetical protein